MSTKTFSLMKSASVLALGVAIAVAGVPSPMPGFWSRAGNLEIYPAEFQKWRKAVRQDLV